MSSGARSSAEAAGLRASPHGGHEEVDEPAGQERAGVFSAAAQHGRHGGETGPVPARGWSGLHQSAEQGETLSSSIVFSSRLWDSYIAPFWASFEKQLKA